jgi:transposase InsO family protein
VGHDDVHRRQVRDDTGDPSQLGPPSRSGRTNGLYKTELIHRRGPWKNVHHVEWATLTYVDWFSQRRIHNEIGKVPPAELEADHYRQSAA